MISFLRGKLIESLPGLAVIDVNGVGYEAQIPMSTFAALPAPGSEVRLHTQLIVREDAHSLYGFATRPERDMFRLLINTVSGIGPKIALSALSGMSVTALRAAVAARDIKALSSISGVGKKTAERIVVELGDKVGVTAGAGVPGPAGALAPGDSRANDAVLALMALGYKQPDAQEAVRGVQALLGADAPVEDLVRASLKKAAS
jgi:Holliday junction DNA helicase RuvA